MSETSGSPSEFSRRKFLATGTAAAVVTLSPDAASAQSPTRFRRLNVTNPQAAKSIESYKKAIRIMLSRQASDPLNWYRNALVHTLDCPHGNWWFLVWHRGYLGWFEEICRELSGDPDFAMPYWDWTKEPRVPQAMFDDVLTPSDLAFTDTLGEFEYKFKDVVAQADYWKGGSPFNETGPYAQLLGRGLRYPDDLWFDIAKDPRPGFQMFFDRAHARGLTRAKPDFDDDTKKAVSLPMILDALAPRDFVTFGSPKTFAHSALTGFGVLESQPHNLVHNCVGGEFTLGPDTTHAGGFMLNFLSPVDPIFFLHHANIDRLWDVWTRKQQARNYPTLPEGADLGRWQRERFLFFVDAKGNSVTKIRAGDYAAIGDFNYDYEPGSGEEVVPAPPVVAQVGAVQRFVAQLGPDGTEKKSGSVVLPAALLAASPGSPRLFAKITLGLPPSAHAGNITVVVDAPGDGPLTPSHTFKLSMFGHHTMQAPVTFTVPLAAPVTALRAANRIGANTLNIRVVQAPMVMPGGVLHEQGPAPDVEVLSIVVEAH